MDYELKQAARDLLRALTKIAEGRNVVRVTNSSNGKDIKVVARS